MQSTEPETWKPVVGYEGYYEVSDRGCVRSVDRVTGHGHAIRGVQLKLRSRPTGHLHVLLRRGDGPKNHYVHRLVLDAFVGPPPVGTEGCHSDGNPANNRVENLRWDTRKSNMLDRRIHGDGVYHQIKATCMRGHKMFGRNLYAPPSGRRRCRACMREKDRSRRAGVPFQQEAADRIFAELMSLGD